VNLLNGLTLGLAQNQRESDVDLIESIFFRFWGELDTAASMTPRSFRVFWAVVVDQEPNGTLPVFRDIFSSIQDITGLN